MAAFRSQPHNNTIMPVQRTAPKYPWKAERSNIEGWVDVLLTVETDGRVSKACVLRANPEGWFEAETMKIVTDWRYNPADVEALPDRRLKIRMTFMLK
jgi:TonB family protein